MEIIPLYCCYIFVRLCTDKQQLMLFLEKKVTYFPFVVNFLSVQSSSNILIAER